VILHDDNRDRLLQDGKIEAEWDNRDFIQAEPIQTEQGLTKLKFKGVMSHKDVLATDAQKENWERRQKQAITVEETDDRYRH
jgi:hypothetical protein